MEKIKSRGRKEMQADVDMPYPYRSPKYLVMNLVTNLVITKLGEEFGDIFVTLSGDSPNSLMILMTCLSPNLVGHQIG